MCFRSLLVVNADDFGYSPGICRGIIRSHLEGIVTSTSVMMTNLSVEAARDLIAFPRLSVGVHFYVSDRRFEDMLRRRSTLNEESTAYLRAEFERQVDMFQRIMGRMPSHLDSHHHIHCHPRLLEIFLGFASKNCIPVRKAADSRTIKGFYAGATADAEKVGVNALLRILSQLPEGVTELICHPGIVDDDLKQKSTYTSAREIELASLTDCKTLAFVKASNMRLTNWNDINLDDKADMC